MDGVSFVYRGKKPIDFSNRPPMRDSHVGPRRRTGLTWSWKGPDYRPRQPEGPMGGGGGQKAGSELGGRCLHASLGGSQPSGSLAF